MDRPIVDINIINIVDAVLFVKIKTDFWGFWPK